MGQLLQNFSYPRNAFAGTPEESGQKVLDVIDRAERGALFQSVGKVKDEAFLDMRLFLGVVGGTVQDPEVTTIGENFRNLAQRSVTGAWRWVLTRSLWLYSIPNPSKVACNAPAERLGVSFNFFDIVTRLLVHLSAMPSPENTLYCDELLAVLDDDEAWALSSENLHDEALRLRASMGLNQPSEHARLLEELEPKYGVGRENMNTAFRKAFGQCGLFDVVRVGQSVVGLRLDTGVYENAVLGERLRFVLDNPRKFTDWAKDRL